jgi:hypothetical protein
VLNAIYFLSALVGLVLILPISLLVLFGSDALPIGPLMDLSVEVAPPGRLAVVAVQPSTRALGHFRSAAYADGRVLDAIAEWIGQGKAA